MYPPLILASASRIRMDLLLRAGLSPNVIPAEIDEESLRATLERKGKTGAIIAQTLADEKARKVSADFPDSFVISADQVLLIGDELLSKPVSQEQASQHLELLSGRSHYLVSAVSVAEKGEITWRYSDTVVMDMRELSESFIKQYVNEEWDNIRHTVGCYMIEGRGIILFKSVEGDYHTILGLPIFQLLSFLQSRGAVTL